MTWEDKIICGDNITEMKKMPDESIDLVVTSPPYDNLRDYEGYTFDFKNTAKQLWRIIKEGWCSSLGCR
jgi:site-specific DNA-methyltransferase (adenine-specific)